MTVMSYISLIRYDGSIKSTYNGQQLGLFSSESGLLDLNEYPIDISAAQFNAIPEREHVFSVLRGGLESPSQQARIEGSLYPLISQIDETYIRAINEYKKMLEIADKKDLTVIESFKARFWSFPWIAGIIYQREGSSAHRAAWLIRVGDREEVRQIQLRETIYQRSTALIFEIEALKKRGVSCCTYVQELDQLNKIFRATFSKEELILDVEGIKKINVNNYIQKIKELMRDDDWTGVK